MPDEHSTPWGLWCPVCLTRVDDQAHCPRCGLPQGGPTPARLRVVVARLHELSEQQAALATETAELAEERGRLLVALRGAPPPRSPRPSPGEPGLAPVLGVADWRPERVRDVLLWLGAALLGLSAVTFAIVTWARLGASGRGLLLSAMTVLAGSVAIALQRRLRATAETLTGLTLVLALVDWYALRRSGVGHGVDFETWWAIGTALVAAIGMAGAIRFGLRSARLGAAVLALVSGAFTVAATTDAFWTAAVGSALVATAAANVAALLDRRGRWSDAARVLVSGSAVVELVALALAITAATQIDVSTDAPGPALAVLSLGLAPAFSAFVARQRLAGRTEADVLVGLATASVIGALVTLLMADLDPIALLAAGAGLGVVAVAIGRLASRPLRVGVAGAGTGAIALGLLGAFPRVYLAVVGPLAWLADPWSGPLGGAARDHLGPTDPLVLHGGWAAGGVLVAAAAGAMVAVARPRWRPPLAGATPAAAVAVGALPAALAVGLVASGASIGAVLGIELGVAVALTGGGVALESRQAVVVPWLLGAAGLLVVPAAGWAVTDRTATLVSLGVVVAVAGLAGALARGAAFGAALTGLAGAAALAEAGAAVAAAGGAAGPAGFAVAVTGGTLLVLGALGRRPGFEGPPPEGPALEVVGALGLVLGTGMSSVSSYWLAATLTAAVPALGTAALRRDRALGYGWSSAAAAVGAVWAWLAVAHVTVLEAYTLPAAAAVLAAGVMRRRADRAVSSWPGYGVGLTLALGPSLVVALDRGGTARPFGVIAGALVCVVVGGRLRLRAPLMLGAGALIALAVDDLGPVAAQLPRWVSLGAVGLLLLWLGASAEHRLEQLRRWRTAFEQLA